MWAHAERKRFRQVDRTFCMPEMSYHVTCNECFFLQGLESRDSATSANASQQRQHQHQALSFSDLNLQRSDVSSPQQVASGVATLGPGGAMAPLVFGLAPVMPT